MSFETLGRILLIAALILGVMGIVLLLLDRIVSSTSIRLGNLPGDISIKAQSITCLLPLTSMLLISVLFTIAFNIIIRLLNR